MRNGLEKKYFARDTLIIDYKRYFKEALKLVKLDEI